MSEQSRDPGAQARRFTRLWDEYAARIHAYALRRVGADQAEEILAETFLVAWRRIADVPGDPLPWLLVVARNTISANRRSRYRALTVEHELARIQGLSEVGARTTEVEAIQRDVTLRALASLTSRQREALLLVSWDGLSIEQAAVVARCSPPTFRVRLHRARERLRRAADEELPHQPHSSPAATATVSSLPKGTTS